VADPAVAVVANTPTINTKPALPRKEVVSVLRCKCLIWRAVLPLALMRRKDLRAKLLRLSTRVPLPPVGGLHGRSRITIQGWKIRGP
jgi:hypothetical protein